MPGPPVADDGAVVAVGEDDRGRRCQHTGGDRANRSRADVKPAPAQGKRAIVTVRLGAVASSESCKPHSVSVKW